MWGESERGLGVEDRDEEGIMIEDMEGVMYEGARKQPVEGDLLASERLLVTGRSPYRKSIRYLTLMADWLG